jgi:hypothetical protein
MIVVIMVDFRSTISEVFTQRTSEPGMGKLMKRFLLKRAKHKVRNTAKNS